ncbi:MAG TPA: bifunctional hydroxymethylpyrimidine kinase/phosphomethylpyrimidine kinase [Terriglobales bacterium]|nr:bifunctional hydroxymethylpyrimidine kinase/phosphomethylpyrimidine kinase [Terriglobales bacterium]
MLQSPPVVLTIAGFDPSAGAGITADIKTIAAHGCYGIAAITALTVQSTTGVRRVSVLDPELLLETLNELTADVKVSAVHLGMLASGEIATVVADFLKRSQLPHVVLDPVLKSTSGTGLLDGDGIKVLLEQLLPLAEAVTPNADEAALLTGSKVEYVDDMRDAAKKLHQMGAKGVVVTGGHLDMTTDVLSLPNGDIQTFKSDRLDSPCTHGTGCAFSTAIACHLALGRALPEAVLLSKAYLTAAISNAYPIGKGVGPVNHMYRMKNHPGGFAKKLASGKD